MCNSRNMGIANLFGFSQTREKGFVRLANRLSELAKKTSIYKEMKDFYKSKPQSLRHELNAPTIFLVLNSNKENIIISWVSSPDDINSWKCDTLRKSSLFHLTLGESGKLNKDHSFLRGVPKVDFVFTLLSTLSTPSTIKES